MDIRIKLPKVRVLFRQGTRAALNSKPMESVNAMPSKIWAIVGPTAERLFGIRRRLSTVIVAMLAVWLFAHVVLGANGMMVYREKRAEVQSLRQEIDSLQSENDRYSKQIDDLKTDPKTIEKEAREQLHYARPGEVVYVVPAAPAQDVPRNNSARK
jgi:cell division protein FtsB